MNDSGRGCTSETKTEPTYWSAANGVARFRGSAQVYPQMAMRSHDLGLHLLADASLPARIRVNEAERRRRVTPWPANRSSAGALIPDRRARCNRDKQVAIACPNPVATQGAAAFSTRGYEIPLGRQSGRLVKAGQTVPAGERLAIEALLAQQIAGRRSGFHQPGCHRALVDRAAPWFGRGALAVCGLTRLAGKVNARIRGERSRW